MKSGKRLPCNPADCKALSSDSLTATVRARQPMSRPYVHDSSITRKRVAQFLRGGHPGVFRGTSTPDECFSATEQELDTLSRRSGLGLGDETPCKEDY